MKTLAVEEPNIGRATFFNSFKDRFVSLMDRPRRSWYSFLAFLTTVTASAAPTLCAPTMKGIFEEMVDIIKTIAQFTGAGILVFALVSWILAMKDENAEGQSRAIRNAVVGIALVTFGTLADPIIDMLLS